MYEKSIAQWTVIKYWLLLLALSGMSSVVWAQQTRQVQVSDSSGHVQYYDEAQVSNLQCPNPSGSTGFNNQTCATSIVLAGDTITWTDASSVSGDQHSATRGVCNPICNFVGGFDIPGGGNFTGAGQFGSFTFNATGPGVFPLFCRAHLAAMLGTVIVQDFDLSLSNSTLFAYAGTSTPFTNLGTLTGQPQTAPPDATVGPVPYNNSVGLSCVAAGTNPPNTCTLNPNNPQPGTPVSFTPTVNHPTVANFSFKIQGAGTDLNGLTHSQNVTLNIVSMAYTTSPSAITAPATGTSANDNFSLTTNGSFPNNPASQQVNLSCSSVDPGFSCNFFNGATQITSFTPSAGAHALSLRVVTSGATGGPHTVTLSADPGGGLAPKTVNFTANVQDYTLSVSPPTNQTVALSATATYPVTLTAQNGYNSSVTVSCQGASLPVTCNGFTATPTAGGVTNNVTASNPAAGQFNFNIQGSDNPATHSQAVQLLVGSIDFPSPPSPNPVSATQGNPSNAATFTVTSSFPAVVTFSCSGAPTGVTCDFSPASVSTSPSPAKTVTVSFRTTTSTPAATSVITLHATSGGLDSTTPLQLAVNASANSSDLSVASLTNNSTALAAVQEGKSLQFSIGVKNGGPNTANGSVLLLEFSAPVGNPVFGGCTGGVTTINPSTFSCALGNLGITTSPVTASISAPVGRSLSVNARVSSSSSDAVSANNFGNSTAQVRKRPAVRTPPRLP